MDSTLTLVQGQVRAVESRPEMALKRRLKTPPLLEMGPIICQLSQCLLSFCVTFGVTWLNRVQLSSVTAALDERTRELADLNDYYNSMMQVWA